MENTIQGHKSCVGPSRGEDEARNSDSGDSVFFSQKALPEAVRSGGRRLPRLRSPFTQEGPPELEDDILSSSSSSSSEDESRRKRKKRRRRRVLKVPSCRFSFLSERKEQTNGLLRVKIKKLHSYMIGGYMKHVQDLWESYEQGEDVASLPTVDVDEEELSPVSQDEKDEAIEDEDIKVVERKHFTTSIKAKSLNPWCASKARSGRKRNQSPALHRSPGPQRKKLPKVLTSEPMLKETPSAAMRTSRDEDPPCGVTEAQVTSDGKTGERPKEKKRRDSETLRPESHTQGDEDPHTQVLHLNKQSRLGNAEHENGSLSQSDVNDTLCLKKRRKKKEDKDVCEGIEKEKKQDGTEGQHEEELLSSLEDINMKDILESKPKKKKKAVSEDGRQDGRSVEEASVASSKTQADWKKQENYIDVNSGRTDPAAEPPTDEANVQKKMVDMSESVEEDEQKEEQTPDLQTKKKKKKKSACAGNDATFSNDNATKTDSTSQTKMVDTSDAAEEDEKVVNKQKEEQAPELKTKMKKRKAASEDGRQDDGSVKKKKSACAGNDAIFSNDNATKTDLTSQQKKKKKRVDISDAAKEDEKDVNKQKEEQAPELKTKKKKKKAALEDGRQDDGSVEEACVASSKTQADWKKQENNIDVNSGRTDPAAEPPTDESNVQKTKNKKKKDQNVTSVLCESPTELHVENTEAPQETELSFTKVKDKKKKKHSASAGEDVKFCNNAVTNTDSTSQTKMVDMSESVEEDEQKEEQTPELQTKKKKKSACAGDDATFSNDNATKTDSTSQQKKKKKRVDISDAAKEDEKDVNTQKEEQGPELKTKKKKQKTICSVATCEDTGVQGNYSTFGRKKEKKVTSSFLAADEEENGAKERQESSQSAAETLHISAADLATNSAENAESLERLKDEIKTKKKKRSAVGGETGFKEPEGTPAVEVKKKKKCERNNGELTSPTDLRFQTDADVRLKKKDKIPAAAREDAETEASTQLSSDSQKKTLKKIIEKAGNKLSLAKKSSTKPVELEAGKSKEREKSGFILASKAPPLSLKPKTNKKRKLYHESLDFLSDI